MTTGAGGGTCDWIGGGCDGEACGALVETWPVARTGPTAPPPECWFIGACWPPLSAELPARTKRSQRLPQGTAAPLLDEALSPPSSSEDTPVAEPTAS